MTAIVILLAVWGLVLAQNAAYRSFWCQNLSLDLSFSERAATEGDKLYLNEVITNRKWLPLPWLAVKFQVSRQLQFIDSENARVSDDYYRHDMFNLSLFQRITRRLPFICAKRGVYTVISADIISGNLLATEKFIMQVPCKAVLTVYPRVIDIEPLLITQRPVLGSMRARRMIQPDPFAFRGIREYRPHDSLRSVNFKATAKTGQLMVNVNDYTVTQEVVLVLNLERYSTFLNESLCEQSIRLAASVAAYYLSNGMALGFISNGWEQRDGAEPEHAPGTIGGSGSESGIWLESALGSGQLTNVNEALAHIELEQAVCLSGGEMLREAVRHRAMKNRMDGEPVWIVISTYHDMDFQEAFETLRLENPDALWVIPVDHSMKIGVTLSENVMKMEL